MPPRTFLRRRSSLTRSSSSGSTLPEVVESRIAQTMGRRGLTRRQAIAALLDSPGSSAQAQLLRAMLNGNTNRPASPRRAQTPSRNPPLGRTLSSGSTGSVTSGGGKRSRSTNSSGSSGITLGGANEHVSNANSGFPRRHGKRARPNGPARIFTLNRQSSSASSGSAGPSSHFSPGQPHFVFGQAQMPARQLSRTEQFMRDMNFTSAASKLARNSGARNADVLARQALEWARRQAVFPSAKNAMAVVQRHRVQTQTQTPEARWGRGPAAAAPAAAASRGRPVRNAVNEAAVKRADNADRAAVKTTLRKIVFDKQKWLARKIKDAEFRGDAAQVNQLQRRYAETMRVGGGNIAAAHRRTGQNATRAAETSKLEQAIARAAAAAGTSQLSRAQYAALGLRDPRQYAAEKETRGNARLVTGNLRHLIDEADYFDGQYVRLPVLTKAKKKLEVYTDLLQYVKPENGRVNIGRLAKNEGLRRTLRSRLIYRGQPLKLSNGSAVLPGRNGKYRDPRVKNKPAFDMNLFRRAGVLRHVVNNLT